MSQNEQRLPWTREEVDQRLHQIMDGIHDQCVRWGSSAEQPQVNYLQGANRAGFAKVADAVLAQGLY